MATRSYTKPLILAVLVVFAAAVYLQYRYYSSSPSANDAVATESIIDRLVAGGPGRDGIPAIDEPQFESVATADEYLDDASFGIDVEVDGKHRFYPFQILVWHELVNDTFAGRSLLVTYSPLTYSTSVFDRALAPTPMTFGVSGDLYNSNTVMFDRETNTRWLQSSGKAIDGPREGATLDHYPSSILPWRAYKQAYATGSVLSRKTGVVRDYTRDPYGDYHGNNAILFSLSSKDDRFHPKSIVYGFDDGTRQKAYFEDAVVDRGVINDRLGDLDVVVVYDKQLSTIKGFQRNVNDKALTFELDGQVLVDKQTQTRWNLDGRAFAGALRGEQLLRIPLEMRYWFSWFATYPNSEVTSKS